MVGKNWRQTVQDGFTQRNGRGSVVGTDITQGSHPDALAPNLWPMIIDF
jgi:hypothetical protein